MNHFKLKVLQNKLEKKTINVFMSAKLILYPHKKYEKKYLMWINACMYVSICTMCIEDYANNNIIRIKSTIVLFF